MIVRDEESSLARCLESLSGLKAGLYITDTGSVDRTRDVARSFGARVREFPWVDDFSAARNFAISEVTEDWILNLDADDYFPNGEAARLPHYLDDDSKFALSLCYEVEEDSSPAQSVKLFRNHVGIRYEGIIHEYIRNSLSRFPEDATGRIPVLLRHAGYTKESIERKSDRNFPMLLREWERCGAAADWPQTLYVGKKLAEQRLFRGESAEAERLLLGLLEKMLARGENHSGDWQVTLLTHLLSFYHDSGLDEKAILCCQRFAPVFGENALFRLYRGITQLRRGAFLEALTDLEKFECFVRSGRMDLAVPAALLGPELWSYQGICLAALGQPRAAASLFAKAASVAPENQEYQARLKLAVLSQENDTDVGNQAFAQP